MPNWCSNRLKVIGPTEIVNVLTEDLKTPETSFSFNKVIPMPEDQEENWYDWRIEHWGIKWDIDCQYMYILGIYTKTTHLEYKFDTPWGPPTEGIIALSKMNPSLIFYLSFAEPGMGFAGTQRIAGGEMVWHRSENKNIASLF